MKPAHTTDTQSTNPVGTPEEQSVKRAYGYGLGHFLKFKQRYIRPTDKERNRSFELGYN